MSAAREHGQDPASLRASLPEGADSSSSILERLQAHGAKHSRYQQRGEVARGGMGVILRVWDEDLRRELAMKVVLAESGPTHAGAIPPKMLGRFLEEAQVTGQLDHPGIVPVHELGLDERGAVFFTMRLVKGRDLKELFDLVRQGDAEWTLTRALWVMLKVCEAMAYAHSKGVIHRDLKPANVMVGRFGEVYVMDWGLARVLGQPDRHDVRLRRDTAGLTFVESERRADSSHSADSVLFTMDGDVVGTPAYMAPEQARGEIERLGARSDVYSVGAMLYHLLTGEMPFVAPGAKVSQHMVLRWALEGPPRPIHELEPRLDGELVAITEKAMAREPEQRYADMGELGQDLRAYLENRVVKAHRTGAWIEFKKWVRRNRALAAAWSAAIGVALAGLAATTLVQVRGRRIAEEARGVALRSERAAQENLAEARRQEGIARRERSNVLRLSAFQELDELEQQADRLWPAVPARGAEMQSWLARAERLIAGLQPSADGEDPGHLHQLEELRARALPLTDEERARLASGPRALELRRAEQRVAALRAAGAVRRGGAPGPELELDPARLPAGALELNDLAWPLVDPARGEFGREAEGLALARLAVARSGAEDLPPLQDTLAWALFANGRDAEALATSRAAYDAAPPARRAECEDYLTRLARAVRAAQSSAGAAALQQAAAERAALERELLGRSSPHFASEDDRWWHDQLEKLVDAIEVFADPERGLVRGLSERHGLGVERRLQFALALEERSRTGSEVARAWAETCAAIRDPARCPLYAGLELAPQLGLVPLGNDPDSTLFEFADLATGEPPRRGAGGALALGPETGVVFVLVPGGDTTLGAEAQDPLGANFDPGANADEAPVRVVHLAPFFLSKYELTQGQWRRFTGRDPSKYASGTRAGGRVLTELSPVEQVSWFEATEQLARLGWQLPTEAQWEHAARGGEPTPWWTGEELASLARAGNLSDRFARQHGAPWPAFDDALDDGHLVHAPVGSFEPNPFGLYDVVGNVFEWCRDEFGGYALDVAPGDGLRLGGNPATRVVRGGSYVSNAAGARSAKRDSATPELLSEVIGLRPMRPIER